MREAPRIATVLVPLDGSPHAERALPFGAALVRHGEGRLVLVRVAPAVGRLIRAPEPDVDLFARGSLGEPGVQEQLDAVAELLRADGLTVETRAYPIYVAPMGDEEVAEAIVQTGRERSVDLIAMATHGRGTVGRWVLGSVAERVLRRTGTPLLLVPPRCAAPWPVGQQLRVLVPLDGSALAEQALGPARTFAASLRADVLLVHVIAPSSPTSLAEATTYLDEIKSRLAAPGQTVGTEVAVGNPGVRIDAVAEARGVHAIAMATHGRGGLRRLLLGSIATDVIQRVALPVLLVRPAFAEESSAGSTDTGVSYQSGPHSP